MPAVGNKWPACLVVVAHYALWHPRDDFVVLVLVHGDRPTGMENQFDDHRQRSMSVIVGLRVYPPRHVYADDEASEVSHQNCSIAFEKHRKLLSKNPESILLTLGS